MNSRKSILGFVMFTIVMISVATFCFYKFGLQKVDDKKEPESTKTYEEIKDIVENKGYEINSHNGTQSEIINFNSENKNFSFYIRNGVLTYTAFNNSSYPAVNLAYNLKIFVGTSADDSTACRYQIDNRKNFGNRDCTEEEVSQIQSIYDDYHKEISKILGLSDDELYNFVLEYNKRVKTN